MKRTALSPTERWAEFSRQHPVLMLVATLLLALAATMVLLSTGEAPAVLYQAF